jgi:hypothetical protein
MLISPWKANGFEFMGYSIRTDTHRYTRWVEWPTRKTAAEELYDYTVRDSATRDGAFLIEQQNMIENPTYAQLRDQLRAKMDEVLSTRIKVKATDSTTTADKQPKKKKKKNQ